MSSEDHPPHLMRPLGCECCGEATAARHFDCAQDQLLAWRWSFGELKMNENVGEAARAVARKASRWRDGCPQVLRDSLRGPALEGPLRVSYSVQ